MSIICRDTFACRSNVPITGNVRPDPAPDHRVQVAIRIVGAGAERRAMGNDEHVIEPPVDQGRRAGPARSRPQRRRNSHCSTGPPGCATARRSGTGVHRRCDPSRSRNPACRATGTARPARLHQQARCRACRRRSAKSSRVLTGAKRLHSIANPRSAMRGDAEPNLSSILLILNEALTLPRDRAHGADHGAWTRAVQTSASDHPAVRSVP